MKRLLCGCALLFVAACEPSKTPPVRVMAMVINNSGQYEPREVELSTLQDVVALNGTAAKLIGGARVYVDDADPLYQAATTDDEVERAFVKSPGLEPRASWVERQGVLWPADFHTRNMATTYFNFERAFAYFQDAGLQVNEWLRPTGLGPNVYYFPSFTLASVSDQEQRDNALYFSPVRSFLVLPFEGLQTVPLSMNSGVVAHEFSHRVFSLRVYGGAALPAPFSRWVSGVNATAPLNTLKSIDEGLADFHAFGASCATPFGCNTRFLEDSLGTAAADARDMSAPGRCMDFNLRNAINTLQIGTFSAQGRDYQVGTILAAALYKASYPSKLPTMQRALLAAYNDQSATSPGIGQLVSANVDTPDNFNLAAVARSILQHITDPNLKVDTCNNFIDMLQIPKTDLIAPGGQTLACPSASVNPGTCPQI